MEYVIGGILAIIVTITIGLLLRKRLYDSVDYYEDWKLDIMNRNVAQELARMKDLNLAGETREKFESWKAEWDAILNEDVADVEELLYDTENAADRYSFPSAKKYIKKMEAILVQVEKKIEKVLVELNELLEVEEVNRKEVEMIEPKLKDLRKYLSQNGYQFSRAEVRFELEIDEIHNKLSIYKTLIEEGNYPQGTEVVQEAKTRLAALEEEMEEFPSLYKQCKQELPGQLDELSRGIQEMKEAGYVISHLDLTKEINDYQSRLIDMVHELENEGTAHVKSNLPDIEEQIKEMYASLEEEAIAKNFVESKMPSYERALAELATTFDDTKTEVEQLKETYYFEDADLEKYMALDKSLSQLNEQMNQFISKVSENSQAHTTLRSELEMAFKQLEHLKEAHKGFKQSIQNLRKDELEAREQLQQMNENIYKTNRKLRNSNLPGVPNYIWSLFEEATEQNDRVLTALEQQPLDILEIQQALSSAQEAVNNAIENTDVMLEQASLTEQVIQYANRYRSGHPSLASKLTESEKLFRNAQYELALEQAAEALEDVEPGALKKIGLHKEVSVSQ